MRLMITLKHIDNHQWVKTLLKTMHETRLTELENKVHSNTEILKDLNKATKPDILKRNLMRLRQDYLKA